MLSGRRVLLGFLFLTVVLATGGFPIASGQEYPTYTVGDFWEYTVEARLDTLLGIGNVSGSLVANGKTDAEVISVAEGEAILSWSGNLALRGRIMLPGETVEAAISGTIETTYEERRREPYFLPVAFDAQTILDVTVTFIVTVPSTAHLVLNATIPPTAASPTYPLEVENRTFGTSATLETNVTVDFLGMGFQNSSVEEIASTIQWAVTPSEAVDVPAGIFSGSRVQMEATTGFVPSPFQALIPGAVQVTHHNPSVGSPVLFQFLVNETEVGRASLETYAFASSVPPPFWLNPLFLAGLLAVPVVFLLLRYGRERRRGL